MHKTARNVVDFVEYREKRERLRRPLLELIQTPVLVAPRQSLDDRRIGHRLVMLKHLASLGSDLRVRGSGRTPATLASGRCG